MIIDGGITGSSGQGPSLTLGDVLQCTGMTVSLTQTEINTVDKVTLPAPIGDKVGRLDIAMDQVPGVHDLHAFQHLIGNHKDGLEGEPTSALVELILEGWTE